MTLLIEYCDGAGNQSVITVPESDFPNCFDFKTIFMELYIYIYSSQYFEIENP